MEKQGNQNKQTIRSKYLMDRNNLNKDARKNKSVKIMEAIKKTPVFKEAEAILVYMNYRSEVETTTLVEELLSVSDKKIFAPKVEGMTISFFQINQMEDLSAGYQDIREPEKNQDKLFTKETAEKYKCLILVPGAVFDRQLSRMGYGKGFYDRFLKDYPNTFRLAPAFECQIAKKVPTEVHDIKMNMIITENEIINEE